MPVKTTCIGAYPKPEYITQKNWSEADEQNDGDSRGFSYNLNGSATLSDELLDRATREAVLDQVECGIDVPTDGEQRRENYIHYHCRHLNGIDFSNLTRTVHRSGAAVADLPTIVSDIVPSGNHFLDQDFRSAQAATTRPLKITVPGPITIMDTTANTHYGDRRKLAFDLADALNFEIRALADAGCIHIQVDEPLFARNVEAALDFGIEALDRCFLGLPDNVVRCMHLCCGYPGHLDDDGYEKADAGTYALLASALDESCVEQISIEDAHRHNDLALLEMFPRSTIVLGSLAIAASRLESVEEISTRLHHALQHIDQDRLIAAPDCGLMMLDRNLAMNKMRNMCKAAQSV